MLVFGAINVDFVFPVAVLPQAGDTVWSEGASVAVGGKGANQAIAAARDGHRVALAGAIGHDRLAEIAVAALQREGVGLADVARTAAAATGRASLCVMPDGHTAIAAARGANAHARAAQVDDARLRQTRTLLVQLDTEPAEVAVLVLRARRARVGAVVMNLSPTRPIDADALRASDLIVGNIEEIAWLGQNLGTGNNAASIASTLGVATVRMMGVQGVEAAWEDTWRHMAAMPVEMRDSSAAADCFCGVLAGVLDRGAGLETALRRAATAAALSVRALGTGTTAPRTAEIDQALRTAPAIGGDQEEVPD